LRREHPALRDPVLDQVLVDFSQDEQWIVVHRGPLTIVANVMPSERMFSLHCAEILLRTDSGSSLCDGGVLVCGQSAVIARKGDPSRRATSAAGESLGRMPLDRHAQGRPPPH
jgi:maltooligosyltrehalose trehalohydrolase